MNTRDKETGNVPTETPPMLRETKFTDEELQAYLASRIGTPGYIEDHACECEEYTIGDHRCGCGNRRIHYWVSQWYDASRGLYCILIETEAH